MAEEGKQKLVEVMSAISKEPNGMAQFAADPVGYLRSKGIDSEGITLSPTPNPLGFEGINLSATPSVGGEVTDADLSMVAGGGCFSLGYYGCYSEGD